MYRSPSDSAVSTRRTRTPCALLTATADRAFSFDFQEFYGCRDTQDPQARCYFIPPPPSQPPLPAPPPQPPPPPPRSPVLGRRRLRCVPLPNSRVSLPRCRLARCRHRRRRRCLSCRRLRRVVVQRACAALASVGDGKRGVPPRARTVEAREGEGDLRALLAITLRGLALLDACTLGKRQLLAPDDSGLARARRCRRRLAHTPAKLGGSKDAGGGAQRACGCAPRVEVVEHLVCLWILAKEHTHLPLANQRGEGAGCHLLYSEGVTYRIPKLSPCTCTCTCQSPMPIEWGKHWR